MNEQHPNSKANLKPFKKGQSGNPSGRSINFIGSKEALKKIGNTKIEDTNFEIFTPDRTYKESVHIAIWNLAQEGDKWAIQLLDRLGCLD